MTNCIQWWHVVIVGGVAGFPLHTYQARCHRLAQLMVKTSTGCGFKEEHQDEVQDLLTNKHWQPPIPVRFQ